MAILELLIACLLAPLTAYLVLVSLYLLVLAVVAWTWRAPARPGAQAALPRIAFLIPAHNESGQITVLCDSLKGVDYPDTEYTVFVLADNCTDDTADLARAAGARVFERDDPEHPGKGQALDWALQTQAAVLEAYDAIALIDADMEVDSAFLQAIAGSLENPATQVIQSLNTVANPGAHWRAAIGYMGFSLINYLRPAGRCALGGTGGLKGSGMAFRASLLLDHGWPAHSPAEDAEYTYMLLEEGIRIHFNPNARVTSDIPAQSSQARVQQERWDGGRMQLARQYLPGLLAAALRRPSITRIDAVLDMLAPPLTLLVLLIFAGGLLSLTQPLLWTGVLLACLGAIGVSICSALLLARAPLRVWIYLSAVPVFILWKLPALFRLFFSKTPLGWQRTPRDNELE